MKYLMLIYSDGRSIDEAEQTRCFEESIELSHDLHSAGQFIDAAPLQDGATAWSVEVRDGTPLVTTGPYVETHEQLGGYYLVDAKSVEEALDIAGRIPGARYGAVEVRPIVELSGMPE